MMNTKCVEESVSHIEELGLKLHRLHHIIKASDLTATDYYRYFTAPKDAKRLCVDWDGRGMRAVCMESWERINYYIKRVVGNTVRERCKTFEGCVEVLHQISQRQYAYRVNQLSAEHRRKKRRHSEEECKSESVSVAVSEDEDSDIEMDDVNITNTGIIFEEDVIQNDESLISRPKRILNVTAPGPYTRYCHLNCNSGPVQVRNTNGVWICPDCNCQETQIIKNVFENLSKPNFDSPSNEPFKALISGIKESKAQIFESTEYKKYLDKFKQNKSTNKQNNNSNKQLPQKRKRKQ